MTMNIQEDAFLAQGSKFQLFDLFSHASEYCAAWTHSKLEASRHEMRTVFAVWILPAASVRLASAIVEYDFAGAGAMCFGSVEYSGDEGAEDCAQSGTYEQGWDGMVRKRFSLRDLFSENVVKSSYVVS